MKLIGDYLASYNYRILATSKSAEGVDLAIKEKPEAIIIDPLIHDQNVWSLILDLRNNKTTRYIPVILTMIIEENKVGWEPEIFDFVPYEIGDSTVEEIIKNVEIHYETQVRKIVLIGKPNSDYIEYKKQFSTAYELKLFKTIKGASKKIQEENPQLIFVDIDAYCEEILKLSMELSQDRLTKNIPLVLILPKVFTDKQVSALNSKLREITLKVKAHPLDVLKVLRDRLKLDDITNKNKNLIEEPLHAEEDKHLGKNVNREDGAKPTILIVDDDNDALFTIGEFVKEMNCNTIFAHNGMECLLMLNHVEPDLIFLDIMMPQMDGFETIKRIRSDNRFIKIPIVALTAYAMLDNKNIIENNGFNDLVTKPINSQLLAAKLTKFLKIKVD